MQRIVFKGETAVAVEYIRHGKLYSVHASSEIILSAGALRSPQLLMLSGVGSRQHLLKHSIPCLFDLPGVGQNHMEHPAAYMMYEMALPTWSSEVSLFKQALHGSNWFFRKKGLANSGMSQAVAFTCTSTDETRPDLQLTLIPFGLDPKNKKKNIKNKEVVLVIVNECRPESRGYLELESADSNAKPKLYPQLLGSQCSLDRLTIGIKQVRKIFASPSIESHVRLEITPGTSVESDEDIHRWLRETVIDTVHPTGTCKMGQDQLAVVDEQLRVHKTKNLRVADASIMPVITSGNTNAPTIMIAEKAASMILNCLSEKGAKTYA